jgi:hypothetical protein
LVKEKNLLKTAFHYKRLPTTVQPQIYKLQQAAKNNNENPREINKWNLFAQPDGTELSAVWVFEKLLFNLTSHIS